MRTLVALARPAFGGAQRIALAVASGLQDCVLAAPADFEWLERGRRQGFATEVIQAPEALLRYGHGTAGLSSRQQLGLYLREVLPYARVAARRLTMLGVDVVYAGEERAQVLLGMGAAMAGIPTLWHLQGGVTTRVLPVQLLCGLLSQEIVCISRAVEDDLRGYLPGWSLPVVSTVYNGIENRSSQRRAQEQRLVIASRLSPTKGLHHALAALARVRQTHPDVILDIAGSLSTDPYVRSLQSRVNELGLVGAVNFIGHVEDVHPLFCRSTLALCPSIEDELLVVDGVERRYVSKEGFCLSAAEAMRAGCPVIASASYGLREVVAHEQTGLLVPPSDPEALAAAIIRLLDEPERRREMELAARARFEALFRQDQMLAGITEALTRAAAGPMRPHLRLLCRGAAAFERLLARFVDGGNPR